MVFVNSKKYACEACIKGHRSSSCHHNDRPLYEIKKKGRPVSQCTRCRQARQTSGVHCKCTCDAERAPDPPDVENAKKKGRRFIPQPPTLPNGLRDALDSTKSGKEARLISKQQSAVTALLNPCHCGDFYNCKCGTPSIEISGLGPNLGGNKQAVTSALTSDGLSTLALVASCCTPTSTSASSSTSPTFLPPLLFPKEGTIPQEKNTPICASSSAAKAPVQVEQPVAGPSKRKRISISPPPSSIDLPEEDFLLIKQYRPIAPALAVKTAPTVPVRYSQSDSSIPTPAGSGSNLSISANEEDSCCCGTQCECSGCDAHGEPEDDGFGLAGSWIHDSTSIAPLPRAATSPPSTTHRAGCGDNCPTCIDHVGGVELPSLSSIPGVAVSRSSSSVHGTSQPSFLDTFFARAASLPTPPPSSARSTSLDPTNIIVYPRGLFTPPASSGSVAAGEAHADDPRRAFGLVSIPKLEECCGGSCGCIENSCACGDACGGCCMDGGTEDQPSAPNESESATSKGKEKSTLSETENNVGPPSPSVSFTRYSSNS